jgi:hypothetical protein
MTSVLAGGIACAVLVLLAGLCLGRVMRALDSWVETERPWNLAEGVQQSHVAAAAGDTGSLSCACGDQRCPGGQVAHGEVEATGPVRGTDAVQATSPVRLTSGAHPG